MKLTSAISQVYHVRLERSLFLLAKCNVKLSKVLVIAHDIKHIKYFNLFTFPQQLLIVVGQRL